MYRRSRTEGMVTADLALILNGLLRVDGKVRAACLGKFLLRGGHSRVHVLLDPSVPCQTSCITYSLLGVLMYRCVFYLIPLYASFGSRLRTIYSVMVLST